MDQLIDNPVTAPRLHGRPTRAESAHRHEELLVRALDMFAVSGFELTSLDAVAASLNMTKRTIYRRYGDKEGFFKAVVKNAIDKYNARVNDFAECDDGNLESTLLNIARVRARCLATREGIVLRRVIQTESIRFHEIYEAYQLGAAPAIDYLVDLFERYRAAELGPAADTQVDATSFLSLIATPMRMVILGKEPDMAEIDAFVRKAVALFLNGIRRRDNPAATDQAATDQDGARRHFLEDENGQLKLLLANTMLENARLRDQVGRQ